MQEKYEQMHAFFYKQKILLIEDRGEGDQRCKGKKTQRIYGKSLKQVFFFLENPINYCCVIQFNYNQQP